MDLQVLETKSWNAKYGISLKVGTSSQGLGNRVAKFHHPYKTGGRLGKCEDREGCEILATLAKMFGFV